MLTENSNSIKPFHLGEADFCIDGEKVSFKKINGAGGLALDWSKNPTDIGRERFVHPIIILQLDNSKWWKTSPKSNLKKGIKYNSVVKAGLYCVDNNWCKQNITLSSNNKTDSLIKKQDVYHMIQKSISDKTYIPLESKLTATWDTRQGINIL